MKRIILVLSVSAMMAASMIFSGAALAQGPTEGVKPGPGNACFGLSTALDAINTRAPENAGTAQARAQLERLIASYCG